METKGAKRKIFGIFSIHIDDKKAANFQRNWSWSYIITCLIFSENGSQVLGINQ